MREQTSVPAFTRKNAPAEGESAGDYSLPHTPKIGGIDIDGRLVNAQTQYSPLLAKYQTELA